MKTLWICKLGAHRLPLEIEGKINNLFSRACRTIHEGFHSGLISGVEASIAFVSGLHEKSKAQCEAARSGKKIAPIKRESKRGRNGERYRRVLMNKRSMKVQVRR